MVSHKAVGAQKVLVIMTRFPDVEPSFSREMMQEKYFQKLDRYLRAVSYGKSWVEGKMTDWYTLPRDVSYYRISRHNMEVERERVHALIKDALNLADRDEDFSQYSMIFLSLGARLKDYGMMGLCGYPGMLGWQTQLPIETDKRGQRIPGGVAIYCESAHVGVVFHDMAHIMGGVVGERRVLPCLYDHDLQAQPGSFRNYARFYIINVGFFDPMSCHLYKQNQGPPGVCAWTKLRLNWIDGEKTAGVARGEEKTVLLGPLASTKTKAKALVIKIPIDETTYYLVENRQPVSVDRNLPSHGILISYCDDEVEECRNGRSPVKLMNADASVEELKGAPFTLEGNSTFTDRQRGVFVKLVSKKGMALEVHVKNGR